MSDDDLIAIAQLCFDQADRKGATHDDCQQLRDIFPAVLARLRDKVEITRDLVFIERIEMSKPGSWERMAATPGNTDERDDQMEFALTHF